VPPPEINWAEIKINIRECLYFNYLGTNLRVSRGKEVGHEEHEDFKD
jgi:hypothetical protein